MTSFQTLTEIADTKTPLRVDLLPDVNNTTVVRYFRTPANLFDVQTITVVSPTHPKSIIHVSASTGTVKHNGTGYTFDHKCDFAKASVVPEIVTSLVHLVTKEDAIPVSDIAGHLALVPKVVDEISHIFGILGIRSLFGSTHKTSDSEYDLEINATAYRHTYGAQLHPDPMSLNEALHHHDFNDETEVILSEANTTPKSKEDLHRFMQLLSKLGNGAAAAIPSVTPDSHDIIVKWKDVSLTLQKLHAAMVAATPECSAIRITFTFPEKLTGKETVMLAFTQTQHADPIGEAKVEHSSNILADHGKKYEPDAVVAQQQLALGMEHTGVAITKSHWYTPFTNAIVPMLTKFEDSGANFIHPLYNQARAAWHTAKADVINFVAKIAMP